MHMIPQKKKNMNLIPFDKQNFQIHFVNVFLTHPLFIHSLVYLALVAHAVTQAIGGMELEDGTRPGGCLKRLHAHCGVCTSPTVMLNPNPLWGMAWLWGWGRSHNSHAKT